MTRNSLIVSILLLCGVAAWIAYPVLADCSKCAAEAKQIAQSLQSGKVTLAKAIESAEAHSKGKAVSVTPSMDDAGKLTLQVFCYAGDKIQRCDVDTSSGAVIKTEGVDHFPGSEMGHDAHAATPANGDVAALSITNKTVELGCGKCIFHMAGVEGCELAAKVDGKNYMVTGKHGQNPHHFCEEGKTATVTGKIEGDTLVVTTVKVDG